MPYEPIDQRARVAIERAIVLDMPGWNQKTSCEQWCEDHDHEECAPAEWWPSVSTVAVAVLRGLRAQGWTVYPPQRVVSK